ncbi:MAG: iron-containing alcohol dehydrogenase [Burkholderiaceae bacterium]|nr:MAG: iron-containing alcohol dehydrogenase [Burkholderiaceae bacterium]
MKFSYANPTVIHFGEGQIAKVRHSIPAHHRVLVAYGGGSVRQNGVLAQVLDALKGHHVAEFGGIEPNPHAETLDRAVELVRAERLDYVLAVGGGSVADGCKYIAAAACHEGPGWDIVTRKHTITQALPLGVVLTLAATGSESNGAAVITLAATRTKAAFMSPLVQPKFAVLDPATLATLPDRQLANGVVDAFVHVCEQYLTVTGEAWVQDGYAEALLRNLVKLAAQWERRREASWLANLMWTANQALNGLIGVGVPQDWATHALGHEITACFGIDHARTLAIVQPSLLREVLPAKEAKLAQMGRAVFGLEGTTPGQLAEATIDALERLYRSVGVPVRLSEAGVTGEEAMSQLLTAVKAHGLDGLGETGMLDAAACERVLRQAA